MEDHRYKRKIGGGARITEGEKRKLELQKRLFDIGVSNITMPSVRRPIEEQLDSRHVLSAKMQYRRQGKSLTPAKRRMKELNASLVSQMNSQIPDPRVDRTVDMGSLPPLDVSGIGYEEEDSSGQLNVQMGYQGGRRKSAASFFSVAQKSITGLDIMNSLRPGIVEADRGNSFSVKAYQRGNWGLRSLIGRKNMKDPPYPEGMVPGQGGYGMQLPPPGNYSSFVSGGNMGMGMGEESPEGQLDKVRAKYLVDKLRDKGRPPQEQMHGGGMGAIGRLAPLGGAYDEEEHFLPSDQDEDGDDESVHALRMHKIRPMSKAGSIKSKGTHTFNKDNKGTEKWTDLDKYIELLLENPNKNHCEFIYLNPNLVSGNPYDLQIANFDKRNISHYLTLSAKGLTLYKSDVAQEFYNLGDWLVERDLYTHIKELPFFKKFRRWKFMKMWHKNVIRQKRKQAADMLEDKLFQLDDIFRDHLLRHRFLMCEMEKLRFMDVAHNTNTLAIEDFAAVQQKRRAYVNEQVQAFSEKCRDNVRAAISKVLAKLRNRIVNEKNLEEETQKQNLQYGAKKAASNSVFEALGFPEDMNYGHRAALRKECSRFLRYAYLVDFLALNSLSNIYLFSVSETIGRMRYLDENAHLVLNVTDDIMKKGTAKDPVFLINVVFDRKGMIPESGVDKTELEDFQLPPEGKSKVKDYCIPEHIDLLAEGEEIQAPEKDEFGMVVEQGWNIIYQRQVRTPEEYLMHLNPGRDEFHTLIMQCFQEGLDSILVFERWSKNDELTPYASALEEWDDMVGDDWEEPDTNYLSPYHCINDHHIYLEQHTNVRDLLDSAFDRGENFLSRFRKFLKIFWKNSQIDFSLLIHPRLRLPADTVTWALKLFQYQKDLFTEKIPRVSDLGMMKIDSQTAREDLLPCPLEAMANVEKVVREQIRERVDSAKEWMSEQRLKLQIDIDSVEAYVKQNTANNYAKEYYSKMKDKIDIVGQIYLIMTDMGMNVSKEDKSNHQEALQDVLLLAQVMTNVETEQNDNLDKFRVNLQAVLIPQLMEDLEKLQGDCEDPDLLVWPENIFTMLTKIDDLEDRFLNMEKKSEKYQEYQPILNTELIEYNIVDDVRETMSYRVELWRSLKQWEDLTQNWVSMQFGSINAKEIQNKAEYYFKIANKVDRELPTNPISTELKELVDQFKKAVPIVTALRNENLEKHHWKEIKDLLGQDFDITDVDFTLNSLLEMKAPDYQEEILQISMQASQEALLGGQLQELEDIWRKVDFQLKPYKKEVYIFEDVEEVLNNLDESLASVNTMLGSRYIKPLLAQTEVWRSHLLTLQNIMDEWVVTQRQWIYLENIFAAQDIRKHLATEAAKFEQVDKFFKVLMQRTAKNPNALRVVKTNPNLLDYLRNHNKTLEEIQKQLEDYLETKRRDFPRFYFLSNDELLEILANSQNLDIIQGNLKKCFDGIQRLEVLDGLDVTAMISPEGEKITFTKTVRIKEGVEVWLDQVQTTMREQLMRLMKISLNDYENTERKDWIFKHAGQIAATIAQVTWTQMTEHYMQEEGEGLGDWYELNVVQLQELTEIVGGELEPILRKIIVAVVTTDVHNRDIVENLMELQISTLNDFNWQKQLRYYWSEEEETMNIVYSRQVNSRIDYGYEYMGAMTRLVITPLTDRCWITITGALHINLGASPAGPAGTGKTESTKDLAKGLGTVCIVFNCSEQVDFVIMGRLFSGLAQQGAWTCLDEFNRINIEVLSVIAQQLLKIRIAKMKNELIFDFEDSKIPLKKTCGVFVTMNPGYAGRTELPDNLKILFRPVAMMIPDYKLIAEIMLFAEGFQNAKPLSKKMVTLYKLSSEQLSQQDHYDFGMRAVKSVLVMAGSLKRAHPDLNEDAVLIRAMRDSNIPKFLKEDLPLFQALVQDLFPKVEIRPVDYGELQTQIEDSIKSKGLQLLTEFILKVIQLFDIFDVRFGVMLVGPTCSGKTACYEILQNAMTCLREKGSKDGRCQKVTSIIINPKSISMGELYGEVNPISQDWHDGLASKIIRGYADLETNDRNWLIFDGPVDSLWIENMNTVLDDTCTLCLSNGQRIKLRPQMRMLFEVQDLSVASPATVSRCGMVYLPQEDLGWLPYIQSWIPRIFPDSSILLSNEKEILYNLFTSTIEKGLEKINNMVEPIKTVDMQRVTSICNFLEIFLTKQNMRGEAEERKKIIKYIFCWSYIWSIGAPLDEESKNKFDFVIRNIFEDVSIPPKETCFEYFMEPKKNMNYKLWADIVPNFVYDKSLPYFSLLVPTVETVRTSYCLDHLIEAKKFVFFTGVTGVGKSVIIQNALTGMQEPKNINPVFINFSAQTSAFRTQMSIEEKLEKKTKSLYGGLAGQRISIFVDDANMPAVEKYGAQPPIELLRLFMARKGMYDRQKLFWKNVEDTILTCASAPPGGGRNELTQRFTRLFNMICLPQTPRDLLKKIFTSILTEFFLTGFAEQIVHYADDLVNATIDIYQQITEELKPTPAKFHYTFNLRDVSKVFQGILMTKPVSVQSGDVLCRLWMHECCRVFHDRLINKDDKTWFTGLLCESAAKNMRITLDREETFVKSTIMWGDLLRLDTPNRNYEEIKDRIKLNKILSTKLDDYNFSHTTKMNLVFFDDAIGHIIRIGRVMKQPRGNIILIGVGGSGKQSLTRIVCHMMDYICQQVEIKKDFGHESFKEFLKELMFSTGIDGNKLCFLFTDTQILQETFIEDTSNILNTGEVPNLFLPEDIDRIINDVRPIVVEMKRPESRSSIYSTFVERVRDNLHICLCMSPVGDALRDRCRQFPSLVNCCILNWFSRWPEEALLSVAQKFFEDVELPNDKVRKHLCEMCQMIHTDVEDASTNFFNELRRKVYTTPKSYLDLIKLYMICLDRKRMEYQLSKDRLTGGLKRITETNKIIAEMKIKLKELQPALKTKSEELEIAVRKVNADKMVAGEKEKVVSEEAAIVGEKASVAEAIASEAKAEVDVLKPELDAAMNEVRQIDRKSVVEIKSFQHPHVGVEMVMQAVMLFLGEKTEWKTVQVVLSDTNGFIEKLLSFATKINTISDGLVRKIKNNYVLKDTFKPEEVARVSVAAKSLAVWVIAMVKFHEVNKKVEPKMKRYKEEKEKLEKAQAALDIKQKELNLVKDNLARLEADCEQMTNELDILKAEMEQCKNRLTRAEKLTVLLADEGIRWGQTANIIQSDLEKLVGNAFLSAASISYVGPFTGFYRSKMLDKWMQECITRDVPVSDDFTLIKTMGDPIEIRDWNNLGLPTDDVSIQNGIIATQGERWPLMIDPQQQANRWVKNWEKKNGLMLLKFSQKDFLRSLTNCIRIGKSVLIEDIEETLDPAIDPLLHKQIFQDETGIRFLHIDNKDIEYDPLFHFYVTTKLPNPHYLPEICIKVTLINFTVTFKGLEDQMLGDVVIQEKPEIEEKRDEIVVKIAADKRLLKQTEDRILKLLSESTIEQILDDEMLINVLHESKTTSAEITIRVEESAKIEVEILAAREEYRTVAERGSILYFVVADMVGIDPMYQYSLDYIKKLFIIAMKKTEDCITMEDRLEALKSNITKNIFSNVSRGLFEAHKSLYSFVICISINRRAGKVSDLEWSFLLRGGGIFKGKRPDNPYPKLVKELAWDLALTMERDIPEVWTGFPDEIAKNIAQWQKWAECSEPQSADLPGRWNDQLTPYQKLLVLKIFRPEKLLFGCSEYVKNQIGKFYIEYTSVSMEALHADTDKLTPIIFVLSTGADPTNTLMKFAQEKKFGEKLSVLSLGQGQGPTARMYINGAQIRGHWVLLQNCHLASSWMKSLEIIVAGFKDKQEEIHEDFRLFLTSMPADYFPATVLQNGVKLTTEPPRGLRANLKKSYQEISQQQFDDCTKTETWRKMLFGLCFFHASLQERRKFGPLGFNILYEFNDSDLETSMTMLRMFLNEQEEIPWGSLIYMTGEINYGGRVTDDWDRRCLLSIISKFYTTQVLQDEYQFSESGIYYAPTNGPLESYRKYIDDLPLMDQPEIFGMHENANIRFQDQESDKMITSILSIQPRTSSTGGGKTSDELILEYIEDFTKALPDLLDLGNAHSDLYNLTETGLVQSLTTFLLQEVQRFNTLNKKIKSSLGLLTRAIKGLVVMSMELDAMYGSFLNSVVPNNWTKYSYPSLKPLQSWYKDLLLRIQFIRGWLQDGMLPCYWLSGFFFPQGFITGTLQTYSRKYFLEIDRLSFSFQVTSLKVENIKAPPTDGVIVHGLYLDGARWDANKNQIVEQLSSEMYCPMPPIIFTPLIDHTNNPEDYTCPVYKTSVRAGVLSTTGHSTNFVLPVELPTLAQPEFWTLQGTAMLLALND